MGDKSIHLSASLGIGRKPKDGKDGESVTILYTKVSYQVSASPTEIPQLWEGSITNVKQTDAKPYLWTKTEVHYNVVGKDTITYSVSYKGKDGTNGTSFTPKGMATAYYHQADRNTFTKEGIYLVDIYTTASNEQKPYVITRKADGSISYIFAEFGDGYNVGGHLYVANAEKWVDFGKIQGAKGDPGDDGMDAINIVFSPAELVFDADDNGNLIQAEKSAEIKVFRGNKLLTYLKDWDFPSVGKQTGDNCKASFMVEENSSPLKPIAKIYDISSTKIVGSDPQANVPASSGGINVPIKVGDVTYNAYLSFSVNVNTFAHTLIQDNKKYISKYTEISNQYDSVSSELVSQGKKQKELTEKVSTIEQKADNIKLEVLSKTSGRRNMLVNSAFLNQDSVFIHSLARIEKNTGVDGVNCIHSSDKYSGDGDGNYIGAFWDSTQKNGVVTNIPIVKGKKYVISCWIESDNKDLPFIIECFFMNSINQQNRGEANAVRKEYHVDNVNEWKRIDFVVDATDTSEYASKVTPYIAVNFWSNTKNVPKATGATDYPTCHAYICKPMMEEGDTYSGWTLSEADYDYVGGNMIDNARTLEVGGSLESINASNVADYSLAYYGDSMSLRINNTTGSTPSIMTFKPSLEVGVDYMFSFLAKGTANIGLYALCDNSVDGDYLLSEDSVNAGVREIDTLKSRYAPIVLIPTQLTTEYKRYWGHMRFYGHVPTMLYLQLNGAGEVYICQPKLEIGATMTEFTERKTDLVDKASLKKAGIEITTDQVKLYGEKVFVVTSTKNEDGTSTDTPTAMFSNGKLNASLIDADAIEVKHLWAKSEDGTTKVGYFGNTEKMDACKVDDTTYAPLFIGANNAKNAPFHVTQEGAIYALMGRIGKFSLTDDGIFEYNDGYNTTHKPMRLSENLIYFTHSTDHKTNDRVIWMGNTISSNYGIHSLVSDIWIDDREYRPASSKACLLLHAEGGTSEQSNYSNEPSGNFAICASKGMYAGFRPVTRRVSNSITLSELDCFVIVTKGVTLTLPSKPQRGQYYKFIQAGDNFVVKSSINNLFWKGADGVTSFTSGAYNQTTEFIYDGSNWNVNWFREAAV